MEYSLWYDAQGKPTWRHGFPPMIYPTHCTSYLVGVTGERLTEVTATGWGDKDPISFPNVYKNPFWSEAAFFKTDRGRSFRVMVFWRGAFGGCERGQWYGSRPLISMKRWPLLFRELSPTSLPSRAARR
jgi:hypothetical protein